MTQPLARHRCFHHAGREAVARCPECGRFYCRECVTEHDDKVVCADCLNARTAARAAARERFFWPVRGAQFLAGALLAWMAFHVLGDALRSAPDKFHDADRGRAGGGAP